MKNKTMQMVKVKSPSFYEIWKKFKDIKKSVAFSIVLELFPLTSSELTSLSKAFYEFPSEKQLFEVIIPQMYEQVKKQVSLTIKNDILKGTIKFYQYQFTNFYLNLKKNNY